MYETNVNVPVFWPAHDFWYTGVYILTLVSDFMIQPECTVDSGFIILAAMNCIKLSIDSASLCIYPSRSSLRTRKENLINVQQRLGAGPCPVPYLSPQLIVTALVSENI